MKLDRHLGIVTILLNNEKTTAKVLAEKFEVSVRTIYRDIENLCKAGIPVITYQGGDGGISIAEGYTLDKSILTSDELGNIIIGLKSIESITDNSHIDILLNKLSSKQKDIISIGNDIFIDLASFYKTDLSRKIGLLRQAINNNQEIVFDYFSMSGISNRCIEPYFITFKWSAWYIFGYCKLREDFRLFKLNRMNRLLITNNEFTRQNVLEERLDLDRYFENDKKTIMMLIDRSLEYQVVDRYGVDSYEITEDNRIKFHLIYTNHQYAMEFIYSLGDKVCVLSPQSIIDELKINASNILNMYP